MRPLISHHLALGQALSAFSDSDSEQTVMRGKDADFYGINCVDRMRAPVGLLLLNFSSFIIDYHIKNPHIF